MKEIEEGRNKWKDFSCLWIGRINMLKCPCYSKQPADSMQSLWKCQHFFTEIEQAILKCVYNHRIPWIAKST